jgi:hypothetical protein
VRFRRFRRSPTILTGCLSCWRRDTKARRQQIGPPLAEYHELGWHSRALGPAVSRGPGSGTCHSSCYHLPHLVAGTVSRPQTKDKEGVVMSARTELARLVLQTLKEGQVVSVNHALELRNWVVTPGEVQIPIKKGGLGFVPPGARSS